MTRKLLLFFLSFVALLVGKDKSPSEIETLYISLDPQSIPQLLAFSSLYKGHPLSKKATHRVYQLIHQHRSQEEKTVDSLPLFSIDLSGMINIIYPFSSRDTSPLLTRSESAQIKKLASHLNNRRLKGSTASSIHHILSLPSEEIDLARALLLYEFKDDQDKWRKIENYEAQIDLMALQILARLQAETSDETKIQEMNQFIFHEQKFRFPPHSLADQQIDFYTLIPSVVDNRVGVCLGVSVLYLTLSQRIGLDLEIITPPGHIYLRHQKNGKEINIETTARGISLPSSAYLGVNTKSLQTRNIKEVIGLTFHNQAGAAFNRGDNKRALALYQRAHLFLENDPITTIFLGIQYLLSKQLLEGIATLKQTTGVPQEGSIHPYTLGEDFLKGKVDVDGLRAILLSVDNTRASILAKKEVLEKVLKSYPKFREGLLQLAVTYMKLKKRKEALSCLLRYHEIDPHHPTVEYYLSLLFIESFCFKEGWKHLKNSERLTKQYGHFPKALRALRHELRALCPEQTLL